MYDFSTEYEAEEDAVGVHRNEPGFEETSFRMGFRAGAWCLGRVRATPKVMVRASRKAWTQVSKLGNGWATLRKRGRVQARGYDDDLHRLA